MSLKRLHIGCGPVYLTGGWTNIDLRLNGVFRADERPELRRELETTEEAYYAKSPRSSLESFEAGVCDQDVVVDEYGSFEGLPCGDLGASEILSRQVFEHLSLDESRRALIECERVLCPGGLLRLDVPDFEASLEQYRETGRPFLRRHILGSRKNEHSWHLTHYTHDGLITLCEEYGFMFDVEEANIHPYPAFCLRFKKLGLRGPAWSYCVDGCPLDVPADWRCLEVGPRDKPWPRANVYVDTKARHQHWPGGVQFGVFQRGDVQALPFGDKEFDFVYCGHVLEHVHDPVLAASELSRVAKAGCVVCPSPMIDCLFAMHEDSHLWWVWPQGESDVLRFQKIPEGWKNNVRCIEMSGVAHRLYRLGPPRLDHDSIVAKRWFHRCEPHMSVISHWTGVLNVEIVR